MASSEKFVTFEPWGFRNPFTDSWFSDAIARDNELQTKALQRSISGASTDTFTTSDTVSPLINVVNADYSVATPTGSGLSGSDHESAPKRQRKTMIPVANGKVSKRKSRASKKSQTTFITTDPANFRQMVQQITGVRLVDSQLPVIPILKPEPQRLVLRSVVPAVAGVGCLPTLDTSAFLLDQDHQLQQQQQLMVGSSSLSGPWITVSTPGPLTLIPPVGDNSDGSCLWDFDTLSAFQ